MRMLTVVDVMLVVIFRATSEWARGDMAKGHGKNSSAVRTVYVWFILGFPSQNGMREEKHIILPKWGKETCET